MAGAGVDVNSPNNRQWLDEEVEPSSRTYALSGKIMLTAIVVLFVVVVFLVVLHLYARWYLLRVRRRYQNRRRNRRHRATHLVFYVDPNSGVTVPTGGLDASVLKSLPVFVYSSEVHESFPECAVCLSEFEEGEKGRTLPKCHHSFHTECIDMWFNTHSTCPLCRSPVEPDVVISFGPSESLREPDSSTAVCCPVQHGGECSGTTSLGERRIGVDVRIDVPRRNEFVAEDGFRLPSPASQGFRSPGSRLLSLKRILSMNRKSPASSPSSGSLTSCGPVVTESDLESARQESRSRPTTPR